MNLTYRQVEELRLELNKKDQEVLALGAKMKTLEEQHQDYQRHIAVLKESLCAKEEHQNMLQADVSTFFLDVSSSFLFVFFFSLNWIVSVFFGLSRVSRVGFTLLRPKRLSIQRQNEKKNYGA